MVVLHRATHTPPTYWPTSALERLAPMVRGLRRRRAGCLAFLSCSRQQQGPDRDRGCSQVVEPSKIETYAQSTLQSERASISRCFGRRGEGFWRRQHKVLPLSLLCFYQKAETDSSI